LKEGLDCLYDMQLLDDRIAEIESAIKEIPNTIKKVEEERDGKASIIEKAKTKLQDNIKERENLEKSILVFKEKISKYRDQMSKATTNKEYQGFTTEINYEEERISSVEEQIIEKMVQSDEIMEEIRNNETEFQKISLTYNKKIKDLNKNLKYNKLKLSEQTQNKSELLTTIPDNLTKVYNNLFKKKNGKVVSFVETEFCGICNVKIRPQVLNILISTNDLLICENCGRILFTRVDKGTGRDTQ